MSFSGADRWVLLLLEWARAAGFIFTVQTESGISSSVPLTKCHTLPIIFFYINIESYDLCHELLPHNSAALSLLNHLFWFDGLRHLVYTICLALNSRQTNSETHCYEMSMKCWKCCMLLCKVCIFDNTERNKCILLVSFLGTVVTVLWLYGSLSFIISACTVHNVYCHST